MNETLSETATTQRHDPTRLPTMHVGRSELIERITAALPEDGKIEPIEGLHLHRASSLTELVHGVSDPAVCVIAQGSKEVFLGDERYRYDPANYLLTTAELPVVAQVVEASREHPYLSARLELDPALVSDVMVETGHLSSSRTNDVRALNVSPLDTGLFDAIVRLIRLLDSKEDATFLAPLIKREIVYRLLMGEQGRRLRHIAVFGDQRHRIAEVIARIRQSFDEPLRIDDVANELGMSVSGLHHHFKAVTAMSPLQFQKRLRLQEARRIMLAEHLDAASAGYRVGYEDASHFSREYRRLFGHPPLRDVERLRAGAG